MGLLLPEGDSLTPYGCLLIKSRLLDTVCDSQALPLDSCDCPAASGRPNNEIVTKPTPAALLGKREASPKASLPLANFPKSFGNITIASATLSLWGLRPRSALKPKFRQSSLDFSFSVCGVFLFALKQNHRLPSAYPGPCAFS